MFFGCRVQTPIDNENTNSQLKSETKWKISPSNDERLYVVSYKEFDRKGNLIILKEFGNSGAISKVSEYSYIGNDSKETIKYFNVNGIVDSVKNNYYIYDNTGKLSVKVSLNIDGDTSLVSKYIYDEHGNILKKTDFLPNGKIQNEINYSYIYNIDGLVVERLVNPGNNGSYLSKDTIAYQSQVSKVERFNFGADGNLNLVYIYYYDKLGKVILEIHKTKEGTIKEKFMYEYKYWN